MTKSTAYEIHTLKDGKWQLNSVHQGKDEAMHEARKMYASSRHVSGVKVLHEEFDSLKNHASSRVLYNKVHGTEKTKAKIKKTEEKKEFIQPKAPAIPEKKSGGTIKLVPAMLIVSAVLFAILGVAYYYLQAVK